MESLSNYVSKGTKSTTYQNKIIYLGILYAQVIFYINRKSWIIIVND